MDEAHATAAPASTAAPLSSDDVADALDAIEATFVRPTAGGVVVADGYGVRIVVERGALEIHDGIGPHRRTRRFDKATHGLSRVVVANVTGTVSFEAVRFCHSLGVGLVVLGADGEVQLAGAPRMTDDARLRRTQALAPDQPVGIDIARELIKEKLIGEARVLTMHLDAHNAASTILELAGTLDGITDLDQFRQIEATAAALYWQSWAGRAECVPMFATRDRQRVPAHWTRYEGRRSVLASGAANRKAERPVNALLNYLFALAEAEAVLACHVVGLDPGLGISHLDARGRQSLALDIIEPIRPEIEAFVLGLLAQRTFRKTDFVETADGHVRLLAPVTHELAETMPRWAALLAPIAERTAHTLGQAMVGKYVPVTPLTRRRSVRAAAVVKARRAAASSRATNPRARQRPAPGRGLPLYACPDCGGEVKNARHIRCEACIAKDPRQTPAVRASRGRAIAARKRALREQVDAGLPEHCNRDWYRREVLPRLATVKLAEIMAAAGCSKGYASVIRSGRYTPHVTTWMPLAALVGVRP